jgi:hypothetical protein
MAWNYLIRHRANFNSQIKLFRRGKGDNSVYSFSFLDSAH